MDSNTSITSDRWTNIKTLSNQLFSKSFDLTPLDHILNNHSGLHNHSMTSKQFSSIQSWLNAIMEEANATLQHFSDYPRLFSEGFCA